MTVEDENRAQATFSFKIENVSHFQGLVRSPCCIIRGLPWNIMAMQSTGKYVNGERFKSLGFFVQCSILSESRSWICNAVLSLKLLNQMEEGGKPFELKSEHLFYWNESDWGYKVFLPWSVVTDPAKGYIKEDSIILQAHVSADIPIYQSGVSRIP